MITACRFKVLNYCSGKLVEWTLQHDTEGPQIQVRQGKKLVTTAEEIAAELEELAAYVRGAG